MSHPVRARQPIRAAVGDTHPAREIGPLTQTDIVRFAGAGGDFNPLHHDPEFVRSSGFPGVISMGQLQAGMLAGWLSDWLGVEHLREFEVRFVAPVFLGDVLRLSGEIVAVDGPGPASAAEPVTESVAEIALSVRRGDDTVVRASAKAVVASS
ncbi:MULTISPECIES: MaoC/PaaZ C-terminal domain-containing protein [Protofrankia]|uniref:MaoC domain protein dehydratase n=1 Tax=Candidatus Protofrankia datiscae TaxID=2716812 RepID=F8AXF0_9ACTN|nr:MULTISPECIES: MaoC/PaaZ C-terminal domain-containing protein [Protofrankia]AEH09430.1 MaoC domain protein dehydratase [Candidatus Protofrankia datiscae]